MFFDLTVIQSPLAFSDPIGPYVEIYDKSRLRCWNLTKNDLCFINSYTLSIQIKCFNLIQHNF